MIIHLDPRQCTFKRGLKLVWRLKLVEVRCSPPSFPLDPSLLMSNTYGSEKFQYAHLNLIASSSCRGRITIIILVDLRNVVRFGMANQFTLDF